MTNYELLVGMAEKKAEVSLAKRNLYGMTGIRGNLAGVPPESSVNIGGNSEFWRVLQV